MTSRLCLTWIVLASLAASEPQDDVLRIHAKGSGSGPVREAETKALVAAVNDAMIQVVETILPLGDFTEVKSILENTQSYVQSCRITKKARTENATELEVDVRVFGRRLRYDIAKALLPTIAEPPKLVIAISDIIGDSPPEMRTPSQAELALIEALSKDRVSIVSSDEIRRLYTDEELLKRVRGDDALGVQFAREMKADIAVVGDAAITVEPPDSGSNMFRTLVKLTLKVFDARSASLVDMVTSEAAVQSADIKNAAAQALRDAAEKTAGETLVLSILATASPYAPDAMLLSIHGLPSENEFKEIVERLKQQSGVQDVEELHFSTEVSRARFRFQGDMPSLVKSLTLDGYSNFRLETSIVAGNEMTLKARRKGSH